MTTLTQARHSKSTHSVLVPDMMQRYVRFYSYDWASPLTPLKPITLVKQTFCSGHHCLLKNYSPYPQEIFCRCNQKEALCLVREEELNTKVTNEALFALTFINTLSSLNS